MADDAFVKDMVGDIAKVVDGYVDRSNTDDITKKTMRIRLMHEINRLVNDEMKLHNYTGRHDTYYVTVIAVKDNATLETRIAVTDSLYKAGTAMYRPIKLYDVDDGWEHANKMIREFSSHRRNGFDVYGYASCSLVLYGDKCYTVTFPVHVDDYIKHYADRFELNPDEFKLLGFYYILDKKLYRDKTSTDESVDLPYEIRRGLNEITDVIYRIYYN